MARYPIRSSGPAFENGTPRTFCHENNEHKTTEGGDTIMPSGVMELGVTVGGSQDWVLNPFSFLLLSISSTEKKPAQYHLIR